jgi:hypothetical protein
MTLHESAKPFAQSSGLFRYRIELAEYIALRCKLFGDGRLDRTG